MKEKNTFMDRSFFLFTTFERQYYDKKYNLKLPVKSQNVNEVKVELEFRGLSRKLWFLPMSLFDSPFQLNMKRLMF